MLQRRHIGVDHGGHLWEGGNAGRCASSCDRMVRGGRVGGVGGRLQPGRRPRTRPPRSMRPAGRSAVAIVGLWSEAQDGRHGDEDDQQASQDDRRHKGAAALPSPAERVLDGVNVREARTRSACRPLRVGPRRRRCRGLPIRDPRRDFSGGAPARVHTVRAPLAASGARAGSGAHRSRRGVEPAGVGVASASASAVASASAPVASAFACGVPASAAAGFAADRGSDCLGGRRGTRRH